MQLHLPCLQQAHGSWFVALLCGTCSFSVVSVRSRKLLEKDRQNHGVWPVEQHEQAACGACDVYMNGSALDNGEENVQAREGVFFGTDSVFNVAQPLQLQTNNRGEADL